MKSNAYITRADEGGAEDKNKRAAEIDSAIKRADAEAGEKLDKVLACVDAMTTGMKALSDRMDSLEKGGDDTKPAPKVDEGDDLPAPMAADAERKADSEKIDAQSRADSVAQAFGESAPPPMSGEAVLAYRRRLLSRFQRHSTEFKEVDLRTVGDPKIFGGIEARIYADALAASSHPITAEDQLLERRTTDPTGRVISTFFGNPRTWMREFAPNSRRLLSIRNAA